MDKILNQEQIDALFRAARSGASAAARSTQKQRQVVPCNFRREGQINKDQVRSIGSLHEAFARNLGHSLGAYLRVVFDVNLVSVEQLSFAEFLQRIPETTYTASINLQPLAAVGGIQLDLSLAFPIIDLLLGGQGKIQPQPREVTEIEDQILESVVRVVCHELQGTWQPLLDLELQFDQRLARAAMQRLLPPDERILALTFEVHMPEAQGMLNLMFSGGVASALLKKLSQQWSHRKYRGPTLGDTLAHNRVLGCSFPVELRLDGVPVRGREVLELEPHRVLVLRHRIEEPARLLIGGQGAFLAHPVRQGSTRAAQILDRLELARESQKDES
jgi:flagellar motor switch protein FliM